MRTNSVDASSKRGVPGTKQGNKSEGESFVKLLELSGSNNEIKRLNGKTVQRLILKLTEGEAINQLFHKESFELKAPSYGGSPRNRST